LICFLVVDDVTCWELKPVDIDVCRRLSGFGFALIAGGRL
jgi:hypothetical protein